MTTFQEFIKLVSMSRNDKGARKRLREIVKIMREYHVTRGVSPEEAVSLIEALGPTFVKIGQLASTRSDILPKAYCDAFEQLHADVSPLPFDEVLECIDESYGRSWSTVFLAIDPTPLGSASIAQVHRAVLLDGSVVAVKVRRPGIVNEMAQDIAIMQRLLATAEFLTSSRQTMLLNFDSLVEELERTTANELDFTIELNNLVRFYTEIETEPHVTSPMPYPDISNSSVLVMQYIEGVPIDDASQLYEWGLNTKDIAYDLAQSYISQILDWGFFHADPHPGNVIVQDRESGYEIVWLDLGMVGTLNPSQRNLVSQMFRGVATNDPYMLLQAVTGIARKNGHVDYGALLGMIADLLNKYGTADLNDIDMGNVMADLVEVLRDQNLVLDSSVTMLVRGIVTLEGVMEKIAPSINILDIVGKHVIDQTLSPAHVKMRADEMINSSVGSIEALTKLPMQISNTMELLSRGELEVQGNVRVNDNALASIYSTFGRLSLALISVGLFLGSSILCTTNMEPKFLEVPLLGLFGFIGAFVLGVYVIVVTMKNRHQIHNHQELD